MCKTKDLDCSQAANFADIADVATGMIDSLTTTFEPGGEEYQGTYYLLIVCANASQCVGNFTFDTANILADHTPTTVQMALAANGTALIYQFLFFSCPDANGNPINTQFTVNTTAASWFMSKDPTVGFPNDKNCTNNTGITICGTTIPTGTYAVGLWKIYIIVSNVSQTNV